MKYTFNPKMLFFSTKSVQKLENEQTENEDLLSLSKEDVLKTLNIAPKVDSKKAEIQQEITKQMANEEKNPIFDKIDSIVNVIKSAILSDNVESQEVTNEVIVNEDAQEETVSEETEVVEEGGNEQKPAEEQPNNEVEENEPSETETVETEQEEKPEGEGQEEPQEQEEKPAEEQPQVEETVEEETPLEEQQEEQEEKPAEDEQSVEVTNSVPVPAVTNVVDKKVDDIEKSDLLKKIDELKSENEKKDLELKKMALAKEVEKDFAGVPGKIEDKVDLVFEIKNATLSDKTKDFILNSLKSLSIQNISDCNEIGHDQEVEVDENADQKNKIEKAIKEHNLTESQALLFVRGERSLAEAKKISDKVRKNRK